MPSVPLDGPLLYFINVSNPDRVSSDSGWVFADILTPAIVDSGVDVIVAGPAPVTDPRVKFIATPRPQNKYCARFSFDVGHVARLIRRFHPSAIVANQVEAAPAIRAAMVAARTDCALVGYCHYVPFFIDAHDRIVSDPSLNDQQLGLPITLQFLSGLLACDRALVHSPCALTWITRGAAHHSIDLGTRLRVVSPPRDPRLVREADVEDLAKRSGLPAAIYNHRLYEHYGTGRFVELAREATSRLQLRILVADVFGKRRRSRTALDSSPEHYRQALTSLPRVELVSDDGDRARYRSLLEGALFAFAPFRQGCTWSMSVVDCHAMGLPVVSPRLGWLADEIDSALLFDELDEAMAIMERLATDNHFRESHSRRVRDKTKSLAPEIVAANYLESMP